jgi:hypothetical protein
VVTREVSREYRVLRKVKLDGSFGRWPAYEIAKDEHGLWMFSPKGTVYQGHHADGEVVEWEVGRPPQEPEGMAELWLLPPNDSWAANWYEYRGVRRIAVDVCKPSELIDSEWRFVDLELDPYWGSDGALGIHDEDEFVAACVAGLMSQDQADLARDTADRLLELLRSGVEPFGVHGWDRFEQGQNLGMPPLAWPETTRGLHVGG